MYARDLRGAGSAQRNEARGDEQSMLRMITANLRRAVLGKQLVEYFLRALQGFGFATLPMCVPSGS
jgi:hypothetical protein